MAARAIGHTRAEIEGILDAYVAEDLTLAAATDLGALSLRVEQGATLTLNAAQASGRTIQGDGALAMLDTARKALSVYGGLYGAYPYPAFTLCEVDFFFVGMEYPAMAMIASGTP